MLIGIPKHKHSSIHHYSYLLICVIPELSVVASVVVGVIVVV